MRASVTAVLFAASIIVISHAAAAWSFAGQSALQFHADYLLHGPVKLELPAGSLVFHFGGGAQVILAEDPELGIRIPIGLDYRFEKQPIDYPPFPMRLVFDLDNDRMNNRVPIVLYCADCEDSPAAAAGFRGQQQAGEPTC